ncbi:hybrid sensor histidine kinase/response regulator [Leptolyngbya cf. ectocarpi LEGE 11479]|uniref:histidine kinase n=1 Tax=Leptolyngbya cf. ectocarpi LEGE 11479 TaxID=1828722 RepID=A0A928ZXY4_LEPEC|nr:hybrid sensor histidine kinase/response regulator [Leptolyngbya ectocarpi]MBE9069544.1 hybrid sensor histidine kinase/response regulator [Leptolyngbya cf. ectocarpi LEGE 11479]
MTVITPQRKSTVEPLNILLIEDDQGDRDLALAYLKADRSHLYQVTWAESLEVGLEKLHQASFDAIIVDLVLPDSRGVSTAAKICAQSQGIPVIVSSYFDENALATKVIELGAQDYLAKDHMDDITLGQTIHRAIARVKHHTADVAGVRSQAPLTAERQQLQTDIQRLESATATIQALSAQTLDLNTLRQQLIATLSQECRSPATVILLATSTLKTYEQQLEDGQYLSHLQRIEAAVQQLMRLIDNALTLKQAHSQTSLAPIQPINLQHLGQTVISQIQTTIAPSLTLNVLGDCTAVCLDQRTTEQILVQLLTNAVRYSDSSTSVDVTLQCSTRWVKIQVSDQGQGIPVAEQSQIFDAFYRASNVQDLRGAGLGLTIVKALVDLCDGRITLDSIVDEGTTVTVQLPISR